nr:phospholipase D delta-like [Tanacetum cinerariifolium]
MIADDEYTTKDQWLVKEIQILPWEIFSPSHMSSKESAPTWSRLKVFRGQPDPTEFDLYWSIGFDPYKVCRYRSSLWVEHLGKIEDYFKGPASLVCARNINKFAEENCKHQSKLRLMDIKLFT